MNLMSRQIMCCIMVGALLSVFTAKNAPGQETTQKPSKAQEESENGRHGWVLQNQEQAVATAREIVGVPDGARPELTAKLVTLSEDDTPFLNDEIVGRPIWHVVIADWKLQLKSAPPDAEDTYARTFDVLLDPRDGKLLKILSRWPKGVPPIAPQPPADSAEVQMHNAGLEKYHGFPEAKPTLSFLVALDVVYKDGGLGNPLVSKQILAHYVVRSAMGREPKAVWAITLRGFPAFEASHPGVPIDARNHARHIVDAKTGKWICAGTSPQPVEPAKTEADDKREQTGQTGTP
jgi:hypothetical protein